MSVTDRLRAADPLAGGLPPALPAPALSGAIVTERPDVRHERRGRRGLVLRQPLVALGAAVAALAIVAVVIGVLPGRRGHVASRTSAGPATAPAGQLWMLRYSGQFTGSTEDASGILRYRIPTDWQPLVQSRTGWLFRTRHDRCAIRTDLTYQLLVSPFTPEQQAHVAIGGYIPVAEGPRTVAPAGAWAIGSSPTEPRLLGVSILPLGPARHYLQFRVHATGCPHRRLPAAYARDLRGVLSSVHFQTRRERGLPAGPSVLPPPAATSTVAGP